MDNPVTNRPMSPLMDVFGGQKNIPRELFQRERGKIDAGAAATARPRANDLAMACPRCEAEGKGDVRMFSQADAGYYCLNGHKWRDYDELMALGPKKLAFKGIPARQDGWQKLTIEMPGSVLEDLQKKFGERLASTLRAVMDILTQPRYLMVPEEDIKRLQDHTGIELKNSTQLVGAVYSLKQTNAGLEEANRLLRANRGVRNASPTTIPVEFGELADTILQKAQDWGQDPSEVVVDVMRKYVENGWV